MADLLRLVLSGFAVVLLAGTASHAQMPTSDESKDVQLSMSELLRSQLEGVEGKEVIVSRVVLPPNTALPRHWHPGEEFAYVEDGSLVFWMEGEGEAVLKKGDASKVPFKKVHSARSQGDGATVLVFRVHEEGQPERHLVE